MKNPFKMVAEKIRKDAKADTKEVGAALIPLFFDALGEAFDEFRRTCRIRARLELVKGGINFEFSIDDREPEA